MENKELKTALDVFAHPHLLRKQLEKDLSISISETKDVPEFEEEDISDILLLSLAESLDDVKPEYKALREGLDKKNAIPHRNVGDVVNSVGEAYKFLQNHSVEIFIIIKLLDKKGYLNKLKKNPKLKPYIDTILDK